MTVIVVFRRYNLVRLRSKWLGGKWEPASGPTRNVARSLLLKCCNVRLNGLGNHECQVQACDDTHAWICPLDETVLQLGCLKFKRRKIEIAVGVLTTQTYIIVHALSHSWCFFLMQVTKYSPRVLPDRVSSSRPSTAEKQPTDTDRDACMKLYRKASNLRSSGTTMPGTSKPYPCVGMAQVCRKYEEDNGLPKNSLKERTLRGFNTRVFPSQRSHSHIIIIYPLIL